MICSDVWPKYREWYFKIVIREIWGNFEISRVVFMPNITYKSCYYLFILLPTKGFVRDCLHGGGGPQVGEVTGLGVVTRLSIYSLILIWSRLHDRWGDPPFVTSPTWAPPPCKQALIFTCRYFELSWNTTALSQSNYRNFACSSMNKSNSTIF